MNKFRLLLAFLFLSSFAYSQFPTPGVEGFENTTGPDALPSTVWNLGTGAPGNQWAVFSNGVGTGRWAINNVAGNVCEGVNTAYMNRVQAGGAGLTTENYLATPRVTVPANGQLRFLARTFTLGNQGTLYDIKVASGTSNQTDPASYTTTLATYTEDQLTQTPDGVQNAFNVCTLKIINFPANMIGTQIYIAFVRRNTQAGAAVDGDRWLLDSVQLTERCLDPTNLATGIITDTSAQLTWGNPSGATTWEIEIIPAADAFTGNGTIIYNGTLPYLATATTGAAPVNFTSLTCYKYRVRAICSGSGVSAVTSDWTTPAFNFCTTVAPPVCGGNFVDPGGATANYPNNVTAANGTTTICPSTPGDLVTVTFTSFTTQAGTDTLSIHDGGTATAGNLLGTFSGNNLPPTFTSSAANGCLTFVFISNGTVTAAGWTANVTCGPPPACQRPTSVTTVAQTAPPGPAVTPTSINVGFTPVGAGTSWEYVILPNNSPAPTLATVGTPTPSNPFLITELSPGVPLTSNTCYDIYVRSVCPGIGVSDWSVVLDACTTIAPPVCGGNFVDSGGTTASYSANENSTVTICPTVPGEEVTVTFTSFNTEGGWDGMYVYSGAGTTAPSVLIPSNNGAGNPGSPLVTPGAYWGTTIPGPFTGVAATGGCLTFVFMSDDIINNPGWVANVTCAPPPACPKPVGLQTSNLTFNSVTLGWTNVGPATSWQVIAVPCNAPAPTAASTGWVAAPTNPFVMPLSPSTCYDIYVRGDCSSSSNGLSLWAGPVTVTTPVAPPVCGGQFIDAAGPNANYANNSNSTVTICPVIAGEQVTVTFTSFNTEANFDGLYVYDGNTANPANLLPSANPAGNVPGGLAGSYWGDLAGANLPGPFTASGASGCLTFVFISDGIINDLGWVANVTCGPPPTCPRPTAVIVNSVTQNSATFSWTEMGTATQWQVLVLPSSDPPPTAATPGWQTALTNVNFVYAPLPSGTQFKVYVRAYCSSTDISLWSNPVIFATLITNDECITAVNVPVNPDTNCGQFVGGTVIGATPSTQPNACAGTDDDDVWFSFQATTTTHVISLINVAGSTTDLFHVLYSGSCTTGLTQLYCSDPNQSIANNLIPGQTYFIRIYTFTGNANQTTTFNVCVGTIPPPISTNTTTYTNPQLVTDVLMADSCATISNVTWSTGTNFGQDNGIGYFNQNGSPFPFEDGLILMTGDVTRAPGPNTEALGDGAAAWTGDAQLFNYIQGLGIDPGLTSYNNASKLEFDFVPLASNMSFNFLFASEEYGTFQCTFSDAFAFFLTNVTTGVTTNLAVLPNTNIPISVVTIRDQLYNNGCASANPQYFDNFYGAGGLDPIGAPIDFNGHTVPLTASATVTPGQLYHIKLVIADRNDSAFDSAVFIEGGSFNIGNIQLGNDLLESTNTALCNAASYTIQSGLSTTQYTFAWTFNGNPIPNETGPNLTVTQEGVYAIIATYIGTSCSATDSITIEFYDPVASGTPNTMSLCNGTGFGEFTLSQNNASSLGTLNPADYTVVYYASMADATAEVNALPNLYTNVVQFLQTIYVRVENIATGCFTIKPFDLVVQNLVPQFTITPNFGICSGTSGTITVTPVNYNNTDATYTWTLDGNPFAGTGNQITVTQGGVYAVTITHFGCTNSGQTTVTVIQTPILTDPGDVTACGSYTLPALSIGGYFSQPNGQGPITNLTLTTSQTVYIYAQNVTTPVPNCSAQVDFQVNITPQVTPTFASIGTLCIGSTAPALPMVSNNPGNPISGSWSPSVIDTSVAGSVIYTFTPESSFCATTATMTVNIAPQTVPNFAQIAPICQGSAAPVLPATSPNGVAGTWSPAAIDPNTPGSTTVTFTPNAGQCAAGATMVITVHPTPVVSPMANVNVCDSYTLPVLLVGNYFSQPNGQGPITNLTLTSSQTVYVYAQSGTTPNCTDQESFQVTITPTPQFTIEGGCENSAYVLEVVGSNFDSDTATYNWSGPNITNNGESSIVITTAGTYSVTVSVANGGDPCSTTHEFNANDISCLIPQGISPNGDGLNDTFDLSGFNVSKLSIFNRYGKSVYSKTEYTNQWGGQSDSGNDLADGTYYFVMERRDGGETKTGWIYINRER